MKSKCFRSRITCKECLIHTMNPDNEIVPTIRMLTVQQALCWILFRSIVFMSWIFMTSLFQFYRWEMLGNIWRLESKEMTDVNSILQHLSAKPRLLCFSRVHSQPPVYSSITTNKTLEKKKTNRKQLLRDSWLTVTVLSLW